jgi:hypothetical protein
MKASHVDIGILRRVICLAFVHNNNQAKVDPAILLDMLILFTGYLAF